MKFKTLNLFFRTLLSLKLVQIIYRLKYLANAKPSITKTQRNDSDLTMQPIGFKVPFVLWKMWKKQDIEKYIFCFLNETIDFKGKINWSTPSKDRLWIYNLQYFQYLLLEEGIDSRFAINLIKDWINKNPVGTPNAWDPFPISLRLVNWIKFLNQHSLFNEDISFIKDSLVMQAHWLVRHLEYHLLGNHLFKNGKALIFIGLLLNGKEAEKWLKKGVEIVTGELDEQILNDGGHFERSPMYHSMIFEDCLDLLNILEQKEDLILKNLTVKLKDTAAKMAMFLKSMCHPDGRISLFNDAAFGIEADPAVLLNYYERLCGKNLKLSDNGVRNFSDSGYYILSPDAENKMILDCGHIGPDYQPGHSHCDTLSFELSVKGRRVIVDSGCFQYIDGPIRQYNRGNIGHNSITIDNENQSEVWGAHRCAGKAKPIEVECRKKENGILYFKGSHDGYKRLKGKPVHFREITFQDQVWKIHDKIEGRGRHKIESRLHLHPSMELEFKVNEVIVSNKGEMLLKIRLSGNGEIKADKGWYCPEFGKKHVCDVLVSKEDKITLPFECGWEMELGR